MLQFHVPELVDRACLPEDTSPVGVGEETHKPPWQLLVQREPYPGYSVPRPLRTQESDSGPVVTMTATPSAIAGATGRPTPDA